MRRALIYLIFPLMSVLGFHAGAQVVPMDTVGIPRDRWANMKGEFLRQVQPRDSILVGDQLEYGFLMKGLEDGTVLGYLPFSQTSMEVTRDWNPRIVSRRSQREGKPDLIDVEASIRLAVFDEGLCKLPPIIVGRVFPSGQIDTVFFDPIVCDVKTMPIDTATFKPHPMKDLAQTPFNWDEFVYTLGEIGDWIAGHLTLIMLIKWGIILAVAGICILLAGETKVIYRPNAVREPAHIVALRKLDTYRSNALWVPEKQKDFYTGVTDALREYISRRYGIGAMEMTSAELFSQMKNVEELTDQDIDGIKDLFVTADFVKFAKFTASDEDNASAVPKAVRFVTDTYQKEIGGGENVS